MVSSDPMERLALLAPGMTVGAWTVVRRHARGNFGTVYLVERTGAPEAGRFALKLANFPGDLRFEREAEILSRIRHAHVPRFEDRGWWAYDEEVSFPYVVMEWVEGEGLYGWAHARGVTSRQVLSLLSQLARALEATHAAGCVHRDVKGDNVLVRQSDGTAVLMDFGAGDSVGALRLTDSVLPPGTRRYRSPEALRFEWEREAEPQAHYESTPADDIYGLGVTGYRLVTGTYPVPKKGATRREGRSFYWPECVPPEEQAHMSAELASLLRRMLAVDPAARGSAAEVAQALERAARTAGPEADVPITLHPSQEPTVMTEHPGPRDRLPLWKLIGFGGMAAVMVLSLFMDQRSSNRSVAPVLEVVQEPPAHDAGDGGVADGGSAALVDAAISSVSTIPPEAIRGCISLNMPKKPFPGQRVPPCESPEIEVNGGCWIILGNATPPCGSRAYEWKNGCYWPSFEAAHSRTSHPQ